MALINKHRYREAFHLSVREFEQEPLGDIQLAMVIWKAESEKAKIDEKRSAQKAKQKVVQ